MKETKILHLTDFHIFDNSKKSSEYLRSDFYKQYLDDLVAKINNSKHVINCIVATGDFIHAGRVKNFKHAYDVIEYLCGKLGLLTHNVGVCIGNHDISCKFDDDNMLIESTDDRSKYYNFEQSFGNNKEQLFREPRFTLCKLNDNVFFLSLDSTLNRTANQPGKLTKEENRRIIHALKESNANHPDNVLIVGSHYPMAAFFKYPDEDGWFDKHVWKSASHLRYEIQSFIDQAKILYLFGDTHQSDKDERMNELLVMTGRIGTKIYDSSSDPHAQLSFINREAKIIHYKSDNSVNLYPYYYHQETHQENESKGFWSPSEPIPVHYKIDRAETIHSKNDKMFEEKIIEYIKQNELYEFGRFPVAYENNTEEKVSLGWVSINSLLSDRNKILPEIALSSKDWLYQKIEDKGQRSQLLFVGIDFWGSIIASQLSILTGNNNLCVPSRGEDGEYSITEIINHGEDIENDLAYIVIITDVVSSGFTLSKMYKKIKNIIEKKNKAVKYIAISVISDRKQKKKSDLGFLSAFGTFCSDLRIPVFDKDDLPDEHLFPPREYII